MVSEDFCEHDWPGSGCPECKSSRSAKMAMAEVNRTPNFVVEALQERFVNQVEKLEHGWVCYNSGPGKWFWMATYEECLHELSDEIRPATHLEKYLLQEEKSLCNELGDVAIDGWRSAAHKMKAVLDAVEDNEKSMIKILEMIRTCYQMDLKRLREVGRTTLQGEEVIKIIDDTIRDLKL